jgi:soluble lytic murein transglycosylase-like protein
VLEPPSNITQLARSSAVVTILIAVLAACGHRNGLVPVLPPTATLEQYVQIIDEQAASNHVPPGLLGAIIAVESGGNARATSASGALGLMQLKRATAARYGVTNLYDPTANITAGARYLRDLLARFRGNITLALAAYKAGPAAVTAARGVPRGSNGYVERVLGVYHAILRSADPARE